MNDETQEPSSADKGPAQEEVLQQIDEAQKRLRDRIRPIAEVEKAAGEHRKSLERTADELDRAYQTLFIIRERPWPPGTTQHLRGLTTSAEGLANRIVAGYGEILRFQEQLGGDATAMLASGTAVNTVAFTAYISAQAVDPTLDPTPPGAHIIPTYVAEVATPEQKELDSRLAKLAPYVAAKLEGARGALASQNPDRIGQASASMQELLDNVLHHFTDAT